MPRPLDPQRRPSEFCPIRIEPVAATERIAKLAAELELAPVTFAVAWTLAHDFVASTIIGATRVEQLDETLRASEVKLKPEVLAKVDEISREILYPMG
ncbi:MAG TPA: aldo/keto reductase [Polyangiaceae bacterium]|nr:aldo/keto reductase [Polyangiaceae bacterium]